jgi:hypothetical protein
MSATNFTPIQLYRTSTAAAAPTAGNLAAGELAINLTDEKLFFKNAAGTVKVLATSGASTVGGSNTQVQYNNNGVLGGSANFVFDGTNVGVGTASPASKLDIGSGDLRFSSTGQRIIGNMSSGTLTNRLAFQSSTLNTSTGVHAIPNGSSVVSGFRAESDSAFTNGQFASMDVNGGTDVRITSGIRGSGTYVPLTFYTNGAESMRITSAGNVGIGTASPSSKLNILDGDIEVSASAGGNTLLSFNGTTASLTVNSVSAPLVFGTSSTERMRITSAGNVGIGTASPVTRLHVSQSNSGNYASVVLLSNSADAAADRTGIYGSPASGTANPYRGGITFWPGSSGSVSIHAGNNATPGAGEAIRIDGTNGNVGIGTSSPSAKLTVSGQTVRIAFGTSNTNELFPTYSFYNTTNSVELASIVSGTGSAANNGVLTFNTASSGTNAERMRIDSNGNVAIGTAATSSALCVARGAGVAAAISLRGGNVAEASEFWVAQGSGGTEAYLYNRANGPMIFGTNNTERMRINSSGELSLQNGNIYGPNGNTGGISVYGGAAFNTGAGITLTGQSNANPNNIIFTTGAYVERARIDSSGNLLVGTTTADNRLTVSVSSSGAAASVASLVNPNDGAGTAADLDFVTHSSGTLATGRIRGVAVGADDYALAFSSYGSGGIAERMRITGPGVISLGSGTATENSLMVYPGGISGTPLRRGIKLGADPEGTFDFYINSNQNNAAFRWFNGLGSSEMMRLNSSGDLMVGTTTSTSATQRGVVSVADATGGASAIIIGHANGVASGNSYAVFSYNGGIIGAITQNGTTGVLYTTASDARAKHDIIDAPEASSLIDAIQVRSFKWNADNNEQRYGFIAQELLEVAPEAVNQPADPDEMMAVDYSKLVPMLIKEVQSLRARVAQLEGN